MRKEKIPRIQDVIGFLNGLFPLALAEEWDNVGLQIGDPAAPVERLLVALDVDAQALLRAREERASLIIAHHPLIFRPLRSVTPSDETGRLVADSIRADIAVYAAHTNLDRARGGLNDWLAQRLDICDPQPLQAGAGGLTRLVVYVPCGYEGPVAAALFAAGAGQVGNYDRSSFGVAGSGTFRPLAGSAPFIGQSEVTEQVREFRLETIVPRERLAKVVDRMLRAHPYEEPAYDLISLDNRRSDVGLGRIGVLAEPLSLSAFIERVKERLAIDTLRVAGPEDKLVRKVALCGGSGASLLNEAARLGADVLVTGDVKYHEAQGARARDVTLIDAGHFATERLMVEHLACILREAAGEKAWNLKVSEMTGDSDPLRTV